VFLPWHSAKRPFLGCWEMALPSAKGKTLGKAPPSPSDFVSALGKPRAFAECQI